MSAGRTPDWSKDAVLEQLGRLEEADRGLQVFLDPSIPSAEVEPTARALAAGRAGVTVGPVSRLAKSFSVRGDLASLRDIARDPKVKSILPAAVDDILPKPREGGSR